MKTKYQETLQGTEKEFIEVFNKLCYSRSTWQVWEDLMSAIACSLSNSVDRVPQHYEQREKEYAQCIDRLGSVELPAKILGIIVMALENNPEQDFLGKMYMNLNLGSHWRGQYFTPYNICKMMSEMTCRNFDSQIEQKGYISVYDSACGAGATLIAAANSMKDSTYNFQNHVLFVGQDIDRVVGMMCYIQLSLLGCAGYICIGNTLTNPLSGHALFPQEKEGQELWYMPMFQTDIWRTRRLLVVMKNKAETTRKTIQKKHYYMFINFKKERAMEIDGFNGNKVPEKNKEALQDKKAAAQKKRQERLAKKHMETIKKNMEALFKKNNGANAFAIKGNGLVLVVPQNMDEIKAEGAALHHCVGNYVDRIAKGETTIFFVRKVENKDKPYFTMEFNQNHIIQCRGLHNCSTPPDVEAFIKVFEKKVQEAATNKEKEKKQKRKVS